MASVDQKTFDGLDEGIAKYLSDFLTGEEEIAPEDFTALSRYISAMGEVDKERVISALEQEQQKPAKENLPHITMPGVPRSRRNRMVIAPKLEEMPEIGLNTGKNIIETGVSSELPETQEIRLFDEFGQLFVSGTGESDVVASHKANGAIIDNALNDGGIVFTRKDIPKVAETPSVVSDNLQSNDSAVPKEDLDIIISGHQPPDDQKLNEDISPLQEEIAPTAKENPAISEALSLNEPNPVAPQTSKAPVLEVDSITPVKTPSEVVMENPVEDPLVPDDAFIQLRKRLDRANANRDEFLGPNDSNLAVSVADPNINPAVDFVDPRITVDNTTESLAPDSQPIIGQTTEPTLEQSGLDNMSDNSAGQLSSAQFQQTQEIIGGNSQDIQDEAVEEPAPEQVLDLKVAIPPATEILPDNQDASLAQDPVSVQVEPQKAEAGPSVEVITDTAPQLPVEPAQVEHTLGDTNQETDEIKAPNDEKVPIEQNPPVVENVNNTQPEAAEDTTITAGNIEDVEPASGALNDPNVFADTNNDYSQTDHGFFASFADKFLHGNKKGRVMRGMAGKKDASLDATMFADKGHHAETDDEILEKAA